VRDNVDAADPQSVGQAPDHVPADQEKASQSGVATQTFTEEGIAPLHLTVAQTSLTRLPLLSTHSTFLVCTVSTVPHVASGQAAGYQLVVTVQS
jgi:hypothetical protein